MIKAWIYKGKNFKTFMYFYTEEEMKRTVMGLNGLKEKHTPEDVYHVFKFKTVTEKNKEGDTN